MKEIRSRMSVEKELTEYRDLCVTLVSLREKLIKKKGELRLLVLETAVLKKNAYLTLAKANRLTRRLTGRQRQIASYHLDEIKARLKKNRELILQNGLGKNLPELQVDEFRPELQLEFRPEFRTPSRLEIKKMELVVIRAIDEVKKGLLQLELLELRCRELIVSTRKALEAFRRESALIRRKLYPWGLFSLVFRSGRRFFGRTYFVFADMKDLADLGRITALVLVIADSPLI
jgi:hypothetical protein